MVCHMAACARRSPASWALALGLLAALAASPECEDSVPSCVGWAATGECERNQNYMRLECRRSCGVCKMPSAEDVLAERRKAWQPRGHDYNAGALWRYARNVGPAYKGAVTHPGAKAETHVYADI